MIKVYDVGAKIRISGSFRDEAGEPVDPLELALKVKDPAGTVTTLEPTKDSTGEYYADVDALIEGRHFYRWEATGASEQGAAEGEYWVADSRFS